MYFSLQSNVFCKKEVRDVVHYFVKIAVTMHLRVCGSLSIHPIWHKISTL